VNGEPETVNLPLRMLVIGDMSLGNSADRKVDFDQRRVRNVDAQNLPGVMRDMKMNLDFVVPNKIDPDKEEEIRVNLPITSMKSFSPEGFVNSIPKVKGLLMLKTLLEEVQSNVANSKEFRKLLTDLYGNEENFKAVLEELKGYDSFKLPQGKDGAAKA